MKCSYCGRDRDTKKMNFTNWNRHVNACKAKLKGGVQKLDTLNFFLKTLRLNTFDKYFIIQRHIMFYVVF